MGSAARPGSSSTARPPRRPSSIDAAVEAPDGWLVDGEGAALEPRPRRRPSRSHRRLRGAVARHPRSARRRRPALPRPGVRRTHLARWRPGQRTRSGPVDCHRGRAQPTDRHRADHRRGRPAPRHRGRVRPPDRVDLVDSWEDPKRTSPLGGVDRMALVENGWPNTFAGHEAPTQTRMRSHRCSWSRPNLLRPDWSKCCWSTVQHRWQSWWPGEIAGATCVIDCQTESLTITDLDLSCVPTRPGRRHPRRHDPPTRANGR